MLLEIEFHRWVLMELVIMVNNFDSANLFFLFKFFLIISLFYANGPILYLLKTWEYQRFSDIFRAGIYPSNFDVL